MATITNKYIKDITGEQYGKLTAIEFTGRYYGNNRHAIWLWKCTCEKEFERPLHIVRGSNSQNHIPSCENCRKRRGKVLGEEGAARNTVVGAYKKHAKKRALQFRLTDEHLDALFLSACHYCGRPPKNKYNTRKGKFIYQGIDRIDSELDYVPFNVVPCCITCNRAKSNMDYIEFINWVKRVALFRELDI